MASLIDWLAYDGARDASGDPVSGGTATFYRAGSTSVLATTYSDADGLIVQPNPVTLDAAGRATVYVRGACRILILDESGTVVKTLDRSNTIQASQVEVENAAFTGTDLTSGSSGIAGGRTDLNTVFANMLASFGDVDWKVAGQNLQDLFSTNSVYFNVKSTTYGAVGDDTTDDTLAIQAAITACAAAGGGIVFFPAGTYKITSALTIDADSLRIEGVNQHTSVLKQYSATANWLTLTENASHTFINGLGFVASATTHTGSNIAFGNADDITINRCDFEGHAGADIYSTGTGKRLHMSQCEFEVVEAAQRCVRGNPSDSSVHGCSITYSVSPTNPLFDISTVSGCQFATDTGALTLTAMVGTAGQNLSGNSFRFATGTLNFFGSSAANCAESGSAIQTTSGTVSLFSAAVTTDTRVTSQTIQAQIQKFDDADATINIDPRLGCIVIVKATVNGGASPDVITISSPTSRWHGCRLQLYYANKSGDAHALTWTTGSAGAFELDLGGAGSADVMNNNTAVVYNWVYDGVTTQRWLFVGNTVTAATNYVPYFTSSVS